MAGARMTTRHAPPQRRAGQAPRGHAGVPRGRASGSFLPLFLRARSKCLLSAAWPRGGISSTRSCLQRPTCLVCTLRWGGWPGCGPLSASVRLWTNPGATRGASVRQSASDATAVAVRFLPPTTLEGGYGTHVLRPAPWRASRPFRLTRWAGVSAGAHGRGLTQRCLGAVFPLWMASRSNVAA